MVKMEVEEEEGESFGFTVQMEKDEKYNNCNLIKQSACYFRDSWQP